MAANELEEYAIEPGKKCKNGLTPTDFSSTGAICHIQHLMFITKAWRKKKSEFSVLQDETQKHIKCFERIHVSQWIKSIWEAGRSRLFANTLHSDGKGLDFGCVSQVLRFGERLRVAQLLSSWRLLKISSYILSCLLWIPSSPRWGHLSLLWCNFTVSARCRLLGSMAVNINCLRRSKQIGDIVFIFQVRYKSFKVLPVHPSDKIPRHSFNPTT